MLLAIYSCIANFKALLLQDSRIQLSINYAFHIICHIITSSSKLASFPVLYVLLLYLLLLHLLLLYDNALS